LTHYISKQGKVVIPIVYKAPLLFNEGLAYINIGGEPDEFGDVVGGKWGFIDTQGNVVIEPRFDLATMFFEGMAIFNVGGVWETEHSSQLGRNISIFRGGKLGFMDTAGKTVIEPQFDGALRFSEGLAAVRLGGKWGYINTSGTFVIPPQYEYAMCFSEGLAYVRQQTDDGEIACYITPNGEIALSLDPEFMGGNFFEGMATIRVRRHNQYFDSIIDKTGTRTAPFSTMQFDRFTNGLAIVKDGFKLGYVDKTDAFVREPTE
jgi:hypothetical protein